MKTCGIVSVAALFAFAGLASADAIQVGPGVAVDAGPSPFNSRTSIVWDNGDTDGSNGYSEAVSSIFGAYRSTVDDFTLTSATDITGYYGLYLSFSGALPVGSSMNLNFYNDAGGVPGSYIATASETSYSETTTGRSWFGRPEVVNHSTFNAITLGPGTYWVEMQIVGIENAFHMVRSGVTGSEAWINYEDFGGAFPGSAVFGAAADMAFALEGDIVPAPSALALLGIAGLAGRRRR